MRFFRRLLVFILFTFAFIGTMSINFIKVKAVDYAPVFTEGFETYATGTNYKKVINYNVLDPNTEEKIGTMTTSNGTVTTTDKITGNNSCQMRLYYNTADDVTLYLLFSFDEAIGVDKITFKYKAGSSDLDFDVQYSSTVEGDNFTSIEEVDTSDTEVNNFSTSTNGSITSTLSIKRFRILISGPKPASDHKRFTIDDLVFYAETTAPQLSAPGNVSINGNVLSFNAVANAVSYNVGFYASEGASEPTKVININSTSYTFTQQSTDGNNYIKIQAVGNELDYRSSNYSYVGTYTYTDIPVKTVEQAAALPTETIAPFSYYDITGVVDEIENPTYSNLFIQSGSTRLYVYGLKAVKGGSNASTASLGIEVGFTIRIRAYKTVYNTKVEFVGYLVSVTPNYGSQFENLNTVASLKVNYTSNMETAASNTKIDAKYHTSNVPIETIQNKDYSKEIGLSPNLFTVSFTKNSPSNYTRLYKTDIRLYYKNDGNGNAMTINGQSGIKIKAIEFVFVSEELGNVTITGEYSADKIVVTDDPYKVRYVFSSNTSYVEVKNTSTTSQAQIKEMSIYYSGAYASSYTINTETVAEVEKPMVSLMFGGIFSSTLKGNLDSTGTSVTYGVIYAKTTTLTVLGKSLEEALEAGDACIYTVAGTPVKVNADGTENPEGSYYQVGVTLNHISTANFGTEITAATYVCVDGAYSLMNEKAYSAKSIAAAYLSGESMTYSEYLGILDYLATYGD